MKRFIFENGSEKNMCMKIKELNGLSASELLEKAGQSDVVPVDVAKLCRDLRIITKPCNFSPIEDSNEYKEQVAQKGIILGLVLAQNNNLAILYRESDSRNRKRFTIAHELAHCCLHMSPNEDIHIEFRTDGKSLIKKEVDANIFAGELLIPERALNLFIKNKRISEDAILPLCNIFVVSENVMRERLRHLNVSIK